MWCFLFNIIYILVCITWCPDPSEELSNKKYSISFSNRVSGERRVTKS